MDFSKDHFLTDIFEELISQPGDPVRQIDNAISTVIADHVKVLKAVAQEHREDLLGMAEERRTQKVRRPVLNRWATYKR
jgi:hypothetical protein